MSGIQSVICVSMKGLIKSVIGNEFFLKTIKYLVGIYGKYLYLGKFNTAVCLASQAKAVYFCDIWQVKQET